MRVYISIPISGKDIPTQKASAEAAARFLSIAGHKPVNPFDTPTPPPHYNHREAYAHFMGRDIEQLLLCDAIFMCEGWENSIGCRIERHAAIEMGLPVLSLGCNMHLSLSSPSLYPFD